MAVCGRQQRETGKYLLERMWIWHLRWREEIQCELSTILSEGQSYQITGPCSCSIIIIIITKIGITSPNWTAGRIPVLTAISMFLLVIIQFVYSQVLLLPTVSGERWEGRHCQTSSRVGPSHWSRPLGILCSHWMRSYCYYASSLLP